MSILKSPMQLMSAQLAAREIHNSTKDSSESGERGYTEKNRNALFSQENHYPDIS